MVNQPCVETEVWSPQGGGRKEQGKSVWGRDRIKKSIKSNKETEKKRLRELDPVGSTVRYEMMKLCTGSV